MIDCWIIEQSHMIDVPKSIRASTVNELKSVVRRIADTKSHRPVGELHFDMKPDVVHVGFIGEDGRRRRFMRLRRHSNDSL
jgi:hypothetical protein